MQKNRVLYVDHLKREGIDALIDEDGNICFTYEDICFYILVDGDDLGYFRIVAPSFWELHDEEETVSAMRACLRVMERIKVARVLPVGDSVWASVESFHEYAYQALPILMRSVRVIISVLTEFVAEMSIQPGNYDSWSQRPCRLQ